MKESKLNTIRKYMLPGVITLVLSTFILILKGIWPFGDLRIDYFDNMQQVAPLYCHMWDWMHGRASLWFDWYTGLGTNVAMSISAFSMISPFNILIYFVPRRYILEFISILTIIKMMVMAISMYALINYRYKKLAYSMKVLFSVMYAFCGYSILYASCFTPWMDIVALFPLLVLSCDYLIHTGRKFFYIVMVGLVFIINYYLGAMSLIYIFMAYGITMLTRIKKNEWKKHAWNIGIGTVMGISLSAFLLVPVFAQLATSQRSAASESLITQYISWITRKTFNSMSLAMLQRVMMMYGMAFVIIVIIAGLRSCKRDLEHFAYTIAMLVLVISPVVCEGTNLMWHFGSYNGYTLRMGYIIAFTLLCLAAEHGQEVLNCAAIRKNVVMIQSIAVIVACTAFAAGYNLMPRTRERYALWFFIAVFVIFFMAYLFIAMHRKWKINPYCFMGLIAIELFMGAYAFIGPPKFYRLRPYQYGDYVQYANEVKDKLNIEESVTDRITNPDISLNANYPLILRRGAQSSFTAALLSDTQEHSLRLGYSKYFLWLLDTGGTVFTDAMLHITEAVSCNEPDSSFYTLKCDADIDFKLYSAIYRLPFVMSADKELTSKEMVKAINEGRWIELNNILYKALSGDDERLIESYVLKKTRSGNGYIEYTFDVGKESALYLSVRDEEMYFDDVNYTPIYRRLRIFVNGQPLTVPTLGDVSSTAYPVDYNNNTLYAGIFENERIDVRIEFETDKTDRIDTITQVMAGGLDLEKLKKLCDSKTADYSVNTEASSLNVVYTEDRQGGGLVIMPVVMNDDNWTVTIDGNKVDAVNVAGLFTGIEVPYGTHTIDMTFSPKGKEPGRLISVMAAVIILLVMVIKHFKQIRVPVILEKCAIAVYMGLFVCFTVGMFVVPLICSLIVDILQLIF